MEVNMLIGKLKKYQSCGMFAVVKLEVFELISAAMQNVLKCGQKW